ncbi:MAG: lipopolysaccharide heptosyltransferase II, partial [Candidatus Omnitrophota bacterium]
MQRILVVSPNWLGDALFSTSLIAALKRNFAQSRLAVLSVPRVREIFQNNPNVDKIIIYDEKGKHGSLISRLGFVFALRKERFDTAFMLRPSLSRTLILKYAGIKQIVGHDNPKSGKHLTIKVPPPADVLHKADYFLSLLEHLGLKISHRKYEFFPSNEDRAYVAGLFSEQNMDASLPLIVINPGANWVPKRWPPENLAELIRRLKERAAANIAITGAKKDKDLTGEIINKSQAAKVFNFAGRTSLGQLGALMEKADAVISADSGPMHIAAAVGAKVVALFGPTSPKITGPYP